MTTLYKPVDILTPEQAEALPARIPVTIGPFIAMRSDDESYWGMSFTDGDYTSAELVESFPDYDLTALVPIEAEEETRVDPDVFDELDTRIAYTQAAYAVPPGEIELRHQSRLVTPWEET